METIFAAPTFTIATYQRSLIHLDEQKLTDGLQYKVFVKLLGLQYKLVYKKGMENKAAEALSMRKFMLCQLVDQDGCKS